MLAMLQSYGALYGETPAKPGASPAAAPVNAAIAPPAAAPAEAAIAPPAAAPAKADSAPPADTPVKAGKPPPEAPPTVSPGPAVVEYSLKEAKAWIRANKSTERMNFNEAHTGTEKQSAWVVPSADGKIFYKIFLLENGSLANMFLKEVVAYHRLLNKKVTPRYRVVSGAKIRPADGSINLATGVPYGIIAIQAGRPLVKQAERQQASNARTVGQLAQTEGIPQQYRTAVEELLRRMHAEGVAHGDVHASNLVQTKLGLRFIDFERSTTRGNDHFEQVTMSDFEQLNGTARLSHIAALLSDDQRPQTSSRGGRGGRGADRG